jgi:hypothetical protein
MVTTGWGYAELDPERVALLTEAERTLGADVVMAYAPSRWGTVDPDTVGDHLSPAGLDAGQIAWLQRLERRVDGVLVAYRLKVD